MKAMLSMYEVDKLKEFKSLEKMAYLHTKMFTHLVKQSTLKPLKKSNRELSKLLEGRHLLSKIVTAFDKLHSLQKDCPSFYSPLLDDYGIIVSFDKPLVDTEDSILGNSSRLPLELKKYLDLDSPYKKLYFGFHLLQCVSIHKDRVNLIEKTKIKTVTALTEKTSKNHSNEKLIDNSKTDEYKKFLSSKVFANVFFVVEGSSDVQKLAHVSGSLFSLQTNGLGCSKALHSTISLLLKAGKVGFILTDPDQSGARISNSLKLRNPSLINLNIPLSIASKKVNGVVKPGVEHANKEELMKFLFEKIKPCLEKIKQARKEEPTMAVNVALEQPVESERKLRMQITRSRFSENMDNDLKEGLDLKMSQIKDLAKEIKNISYGEELISKISMIKRLTTQAIRYDNRNFELTGKYLIEKEVAPFMRRAPQRRQSQEMLPSFYTNRLDTVLKMISESACPYKIRYLANKVKYLTTKLDELKTLGFESEEGLTEDLGVDM